MHSRDGTEEMHWPGGGKVSRMATPNIGHKEEKSKGEALPGKKGVAGKKDL
jgi:hypothetical protein